MTSKVCMRVNDKFEGEKVRNLDGTNVKVFPYKAKGSTKGKII